MSHKNEIDKARTALMVAVQGHTGNATFTRYIESELAGDFAVELAAMLAAVPLATDAGAPMLTDEQREAVEAAERILADAGFTKTVNGLRSLLAATPSTVHQKHSQPSNASEYDVEAFARALIPDDDRATIIIDYAKGEPVVQSVLANDLTGAIRRPIEKIIVRNSNLADNHPKVRHAVAEMQHCGYRVEVES